MFVPLLSPDSHGFNSSLIKRPGRRKGQTKAWLQRDNRAIAATEKQKTLKLTRLSASASEVRSIRAEVRAKLAADAAKGPKGKRGRGVEGAQTSSAAG